MNQTTIDKTKEIFGGVIPADRNEFFKYVLENMDNMVVLSLHNDEYCNSYPDDYIYNNDEYTFCENFGHRNPYDVIDLDNLAEYCERNPSVIEDYVDMSEIYLAFCCGAIGVEELTDEELDNVDAQTLIDEDWDDVIQDIIDNREEEEQE